MSVRNCMYPWHWMVVTNDGDVLPCGHGSTPVGNLHLQSAEDIWNGDTMRELRRAILVGRVHRVCRSNDCPYQQDHLTFSPDDHRALIGDELAESFDEAWYLAEHPDVQLAVARRQFASGFEHYARHGQREGREFRIVSRQRIAVESPTVEQNAALALVEYARLATVLRSRPVDIVLQVSTVCNLRCVMCSHGNGGVDRPRHMPLRLIERLGNFIDIAARMIVSGLGEPLLAPAFWALVERCKDRQRVFIRANSNGHLLTPPNAQRVLESGLKEISFSLDAATPETYAKIRGADFARAVRGVRTMCETRAQHPRPSLEVFINMTLMVENVAEAPRFVELAHELGVDAVLFSQLFPFGDDPSWRVTRKEWTFVYSEQMLPKAAEQAGVALREAEERAAQLGMRVIFLSNSGKYLERSTDVPVNAMPVLQNEAVYS